MKVAALDLGSNTFLLLIAEVTDGKIVKTYTDTIETVRLGEGVDKSKRLSASALHRADECLKKFKTLIELHQPTKVLAMATSAARDSENRGELFEIGAKYNIPIEIIPGPREAHITFTGAMSGQRENVTRLIVDIGGGSTEFIVGDLESIQASKSLNIGCVRLTEKFITAQPTADEDVTNAQNFIQHSFNDLKLVLNDEVSAIVAVAGTPTSLIAASLGRFDADEVEGKILTRSDLLKWKSRLQLATHDEKLKMGLPAGRADVILIGVLILLETLNRFKKNELSVSTRGVRHGIALEIASRFAV